MPKQRTAGCCARYTQHMYAVKGEHCSSLSVQASASLRCDAGRYALHTAHPPGHIVEQQWPQQRHGACLLQGLDVL